MNTDYNKIDEEYKKIDNLFEDRLKIAKNTDNNTLYADYYFQREAEKRVIKFQLTHEDDAKEKLTEAVLLNEFEMISPVANKSYLNIYLKKRLGNSYTSSKLRGVWDLLRADMDFYKSAGTPEALNTWDGIYHVDSHEIEHRRAIGEAGLHDKFIPHYNPKATAPNFQKVLSELNTLENPSLGQDLLKMYAYCAFGGNKQKIMFILYGEGDDGKSLIQNAIRNALGDYVGVIAPQKIRYSRSKEDQFQTWLLNMENKRFGIVSEWGESDRLDNSIVKQVVSGGDGVAEIEQKNKNEQKEVALTFTFVIDTNFLPDVTNVEPALTKRIAVLKFNRQYSEDEKDLTLGKKLKAERAGILNMLIDAYDPEWKIPEKYKQALLDEQAKQQLEVDESIETVLKGESLYVIDLQSTTKVPTSSLFTLNVTRALDAYNIKKKDVKAYLKRQGVKEDTNGGTRGFIGLSLHSGLSQNY